MRSVAATPLRDGAASIVEQLPTLEDDAGGHRRRQRTSSSTTDSAHRLLTAAETTAVVPPGWHEGAAIIRPKPDPNSAGSAGNRFFVEGYIHGPQLHAREPYWRDAPPVTDGSIEEPRS